MVKAKKYFIVDNGEDLRMNTPDMKPTLEMSQSSVPDGFEVVPNFFPMKCNAISETLVDDKSQLAEDLSMNLENAATGLKFSPDMFFADAGDNCNEPDKKKMCIVGRKK
ncbi:hypothetical protein JTB14_017993 [Gonioctena quinquepunctata]|nr:hypothetical protein JTB14_017993 [Gonioctena quinquepunctata]